MTSRGADATKQAYWRPSCVFYLTHRDISRSRRNQAGILAAILCFLTYSSWHLAEQTQPSRHTGGHLVFSNLPIVTSRGVDASKQAYWQPSCVWQSSLQCFLTFRVRLTLESEMCCVSARLLARSYGNLPLSLWTLTS